MICLEVVRGHKFQSKIFGLSLGIFGTVFGKFGLNFWDYFRIIQVEFSGLFLDSPYRIFRTVFGQSRPLLRFGFDLVTDVFGFIFHLGVVLVFVEH